MYIITSLINSGIGYYVGYYEGKSQGRRECEAEINESVKIIRLGANKLINYKSTLEAHIVVMVKENEELKNKIASMNQHKMKKLQ